MGYIAFTDIRHNGIRISAGNEITSKDLPASVVKELMANGAIRKVAPVVVEEEEAIIPDPEESDKKEE